MINIENAQSSPGLVGFQARIIKPDSTPLQEASVNFRFTITDPVGTCVLYSEDFVSQNMSNSGGLVVLAIGGGAKAYPAGAMTMFDIFDNMGHTYTCQSGGTYTSGSTDRRKVIMQFNDGTGWQTIPAIDMNSTPFSLQAMSAQKLGVYSESDFLRPATLPTCTASEALTFNGTSFTCLNTSTGSVTNVSSANAYLSVATGTTTPVLTANVGTVANTLAAGDDARITGAAQKSANLSDLASAATARTNLGLGSAAVLSVGTASGDIPLLTAAGKLPVSTIPGTVMQTSDVAGGDLTGSYPSPGVATVGGKTAGQVGTAVDDTTNATSANTASRIVKRDASGNFIAGAITATSFSGTNVISRNLQLNDSGNNAITVQTVNAGVTPYTIVLPAAIGSANQVVGWNAAANAWEYKSITAGSGVSIVHSAGGIQINATGLGGTVTNVSSANAYLGVATSSSTPVITANVGTVANTLAAGDDARFTDARAPTGVASGDLTGTYPAPTLATTGVVAGSGYTKFNVDAKGRVTSAGTLNSADVTTAMGYTPAAVSSQWTTSGADINYMAGKVGIGTTSPGYALDVGAGTINTTGSIVNRSDNSGVFVGGGALGRLYWGGSALHLVSNNSAEIQMVQTGAINMTAGGTNQDVTLSPSGTGNTIVNGKVGIGVPSPTYKLDVSGDVNVTGNFKVNGVNIASGILNSVSSGGAPIVVGGTSADPTISIMQAATAASGYLTSSDWNTFNNKLSSTLNSGLIFVGNGSNVATGVTLSGDATIANTGVLTLVNSATTRSNLGLGTAAALNVPVVGNAAVGEVVKGDDTRLTDSRTPSGVASGDLSGTYPAPALTTTGVVAGNNYTKFDVDAKGRITSAASLNSADVTTALGYTPGAVSSQWTTSGATINYMGGNIGVGTTAPTASVHVVGTNGYLIKSEGTTDGENAILSVADSSTNNHQILFGYDKDGSVMGTGREGSYLWSFGSDFFLNQYSSNDVIIATANSERFRVSATGGLSVGSTVWNATDPGAGNVAVQGHAALGSSSAINGSHEGVNYNSIVDINEVATTTGVDNVNGITNFLTYNPSADASSISVTGTETQVLTQTGNSNAINQIIGNFILADHKGSGNNSITAGIVAAASNSSTAAVGILRGADFYAANSGTGAVTEAFGIRTFVENTGGGTIANSYGLYIDAVEGTNTYGIYQNTSTNKNYFAGNVGIGTMSPSNSLHVVGGGHYNEGLTLQYSGAGSPWNLVQGIDSKFYIGYGVGAASADVMVMDTTGKVGIGTTSPSYKLDVAGDVNVTGNFKVNGVNITSGTLNSVASGGAPIVVGGTSADPTISITKATASASGYLTSSDWNIFNNKLSSITSTDITTALSFTPLTNSLNSGLIFVGDGTNVATGVILSGDATLSNTGVLTLASTAVVAGSNFTKFDVDAKGRVTSAGALSSADITTALGYTPSAVASQWSTSGATINYMAGGVGIGTTTPNAKLNIVPSVGDVGISLKSRTYGNGDDIQVQYPGNTSLAFRAYYGSSFDYMGGYILEGSRTDPSGAGLFLTSNVIDSSSTASVIITGAQSDGTTNLTNATILDVTKKDGSTLFKVSGSGKVGVGIVTPVYKLDVAGDVNVTGNFKVNGVNIASGTVNSVTSGGAPLVVGGTSADPTISITQAATAASGYLTSSDWNTFNNKLANFSSMVSSDVTTALGYTPLANGLNSGLIFVGNGSNVATGVALSGDATLSNTGVITLASTAVVAGSNYTKFDVDAKGRVTSAGSLSSADVTTALGYTPGAVSSQWTTSGATINYMAGNVGIGVTTPNVPLHIGNGAAGVNLSSARVSILAASATDTGFGVTQTTSGVAGLFHASSSGLYAGTTSNHNFILRSNDLDRMIIADNGYVGVGANTPGTDFDLAKTNASGVVNSRVLNNSAAAGTEAIMQVVTGTANAYTNFANVDGATPYGIIATASGNTGGLYLDVTADAPLIIRTNSSNERMRVDGDGKVGIGTPTPTEKLEVVGNIRAPAGQISGSSFSIASGTIDFNAGNSGTTSYDCTNATYDLDFVNLQDGGSYTLVVTGAGTGQCNFNPTTTGVGAGALTFKFNPSNSTRTASSETVYSFVRVGSKVYVSWITGF